MMQFLLVAAGGALGAVARYGLGLTVGRLTPDAAWPQSWPWGTFAANILGGLLMGLLAGWLALKAGAGQEGVRLFAAVGLLGGFTTFSAFSLEAALMIERRELATAFVYAVSSVVLSIAALFVGLMIARKLFTGVGA